MGKLPYWPKILIYMETMSDDPCVIPSLRCGEVITIKDFLVRAWREAIYGNNDLEALLQPAIATK